MILWHFNMQMTTSPSEQRRERLVQAGALAVLLALGALALVGPYGVLAWSENSTALDQRTQRISKLQAEKAELENRTALLDPDNVDPDLGSELIRSQLGVAHPDEYVFELDAEH